MRQEDKLHNIRHTGAHILAHAVLNLYGDKVKFGIGPVIDTGFYYDFLFPTPFSEEDLPKIEKEMKSIIKKKLAVEHELLEAKEAKTRMKKAGQDFKVELIDEIEKGKRDIEGMEKGKISFYRIGNFVDLCKGGHVKSTAEIPADGFKLTGIAGAYWKGDEKKPMLTRIYAAAFATKDELKNYLTALEEAKKRDHKKLGKELDLFTFSDLVGGGLPLFTPKGTIIREELENFVQSLQIPRGYQRVRIPHITKKDLYEASGHWQKFENELFKIITREGHEFAMKPMNCPHHTQIYASKKRSYRELPIRYSEVTAVYRDEQSGELSGLSRVRMITQDDAHVFCTMSQVEQEVLAVWDIVDEFYKPFNMPLTVRFSRHDPDHFEKYLGTPAIWAEAEKRLLAVLKKRTKIYTDGLGEAAMYGPKIDFIAKDSLGREWQLATIQLDFNLPERFGLTYTNEKGQEERPVMIHRAILGSVERFMSVLIEHYAGAFPLWLSPVQAMVIQVTDKVGKYAASVKNELAKNGVRAELDDRNESIGKKIREAEKQKTPYMIIVGEKESASAEVSVRMRGEKDLGSMSLADLLSKLLSEIRDRQASE